MNQQELRDDFFSIVEQYKQAGGDVNALLTSAQAAATNPGTPYLNLNQWRRSDKPVMEDFNEDNKKIDEGFRVLQSEITALRAELVNKVNGSWNIRRSLENIGLKPGTETIESIHAALPDYSTLYFSVGNGSNASMFPVGYESVEVVRIIGGRTMWRFFSNSTTVFKCWAGTTYENNGTLTWSGWKEIT